MPNIDKNEIIIPFNALNNEVKSGKDICEADNPISVDKALDESRLTHLKKALQAYDNRSY